MLFGVVVVAAVLNAATATSLAEYASDYTKIWMCHEYEGGQDDAWCGSIGFEDGFEFAFGGLTPGASWCLPCMCCRRGAIQLATPARTTEVATPARTTPAGTTEAPSSATADNATISDVPVREEQRVSKQTFAIEGLAPALLAGQGGSVEGGNLTLSHNSGFTLFSKFEDTWAPENIAQLKLLGKAMTFTVDLSGVGCACNVAFYLISAPGRDRNGKPYPGPKNNGGQPPYYCDANKVGGQWCPEVDIMEANNHAFQATPHKCDAPVNGHYSSCDRGGCSQNTRDEWNSYGPGDDYTIDTRRPFEVRTEFPQKGGVLAGMVTTLRQAGQRVVLDHSNCEAADLAMLSGAMADGMSLRITYWGDSAETMAWMDAPPCGPQECNAHTAGDAVISDVSVDDIAEIQDFVWIITDPQDSLFGHEVPKEVVENQWLFTRNGSLGVANWQGAEHSASRQTRLANPALPGLKDCDDDALESPCEISLKKAGFANIFVKKFLAQRASDAAGAKGQHLASPATLAAAVAPLLAACLFGVASTFIALRLSRCCQRREEPWPAAAAGSSAAGSDANSHGHPSPTAALGTGVGAAGGGSALGSGLDLGSRKSPFLSLRKGSSCQQLLTLSEVDA